MQHFPRYALCFISAAALTFLAVSARNNTIAPALASRPLYDWDIPELAVHLNRSGVEVRLWTVPKHGPLTNSAYLTATTKEWGDLNELGKDPKRIQEWHGTLYCECVGERDATHLLQQWGEHCLAVGPFLFYGDAELLERVRNALADIELSHAP